MSGHMDAIPRRVPVLVTPSLSINNQVLGYNKVAYENRLRASRNSLVDVYNTEAFAAYSAHSVNTDMLAYWGNKTARSAFVWDAQPELIRLPITGTPDKYSVQYALFQTKPAATNIKKKPVKPTLIQSVRKVFLNKPIVFNQ